MDCVKKAHLAKPRGFCSGVKAALEALDKALKDGPLPVCALHEIVHNEHVVDSFAKKGVRFIERLEDAPPGSTLVFSAHGVSQETEDKAKAMPVKLVDATCPLVKNLQKRAQACEANGAAVVLLGHKDHNEIKGVLGRLKKPATVVASEAEIEELPPFKGPCVCLTQTTLSSDDVAKLVAKLKERNPQLQTGGDVCYATKDRQNAVKRLAKICDLVIVVGSQRSSNSKRLKEVAEAAGAKALLVAGAAEIPASALSSAKSVGVTAGASAPESLVAETVRLLKSRGFELQEEPGDAERGPR